MCWKFVDDDDHHKPKYCYRSADATALYDPPLGLFRTLSFSLSSWDFHLWRPEKLLRPRGRNLHLFCHFSWYPSLFNSRWYVRETDEIIYWIVAIVDGRHWFALLCSMEAAVVPCVGRNEWKSRMRDIGVLDEQFNASFSVARGPFGLVKHPAMSPKLDRHERTYPSSGCTHQFWLPRTNHKHTTFSSPSSRTPPLSLSLFHFLFITVASS